jgi:hypothetical protein
LLSGFGIDPRTFVSTDLSDRVKSHLPKWAATVQEQAASLPQSPRDTGHGSLLHARVASIQGTDTHGERDVVRCFSWCKFEVFDRYGTEAQTPGGNFRRGSPQCLRDCRLGTIDAEDEAAFHAPGYGPGSCTRAATYLQDAHSVLHGQGFHDCSEAGR